MCLFEFKKAAGCHILKKQNKKKQNPIVFAQVQNNPASMFLIHFKLIFPVTKCANLRLQIDIVLRLSSSTAGKKAKFTIRHTYAPKSIEGDYTQNFV